MEGNYLMAYFKTRANTLQSIKKEVVHISHKILSQELKYLERDGLIKRISYPTIPPKVEYLSTKRGKSLESILLELCNWGKQYMR